MRAPGTGRRALAPPRSPRPGSHGTEPIPTLDELLDAWPDARLNIDCKSDAGVRPLVDVITPPRRPRSGVPDVVQRSAGPRPAPAARATAVHGGRHVGAGRCSSSPGWPPARWPPRCPSVADRSPSSPPRFVRRCHRRGHRRPRVDDRRRGRDAPPPRPRRRRDHDRPPGRAPRRARRAAAPGTSSRAPRITVVVDDRPPRPVPRRSRGSRCGGRRRRPAGHAGGDVGVRPRRQRRRRGDRRQRRDRRHRAAPVRHGRRPLRHRVDARRRPRRAQRQRAGRVGRRRRGAARRRPHGDAVPRRPAQRDDPGLRRRLDRPARALRRCSISTSSSPRRSASPPVGSRPDRCSPSSSRSSTTPASASCTSSSTRRCARAPSSAGRAWP